MIPPEKRSQTPWWQGKHVSCRDSISCIDLTAYAEDIIPWIHLGLSHLCLAQTVLKLGPLLHLPFSVLLRKFSIFNQNKVLPNKITTTSTPAEKLIITFHLFCDHLWSSLEFFFFYDFHFSVRVFYYQLTCLTHLIYSLIYFWKAEIYLLKFCLLSIVTPPPLFLRCKIWQHREENAAVRYTEPARCSVGCSAGLIRRPGNVNSIPVFHYRGGEPASDKTPRLRQLTKESV